MSSSSEPSRAQDKLSILYVLHGFPPDTWAGTEVYTLELARAMQARGHRVAVAARAPAPSESEKDWTVDEDSFQGLSVHRIRRRVDRRPIGETYKAKEAASVFLSILERERPDVVHFQHLLHLSADLVPFAKQCGIPCVVTLNDYWPLCSRVQLMRPDGVRCERNQGMGCFPCVKDKSPRLVPIFKAAGPLLHPFVNVLDRVAGGESSTNRIARFTRSWIDLRDRHGYLLRSLAQADLLVAPSRFLRERYLETGFFDPERVIHSDYGVGGSGRGGSGLRGEVVGGDGVGRGDVSGVGLPEAGVGGVDIRAQSAQMRQPARSIVAPKSLSDRIRFGFVGSLVAHKGIETLVLAMNQLSGLACELNVFGSFLPEEDPFHARLNALARSGNVRFRGRFENEQIAEVYREIDVLVVPSVWFENSPLTIHEAFLFETPVVTSGIGGMAELVRDSVDGLHVRPGDADSLASALKRFVEEPELGARLSRNIPRVKSVAEDAEETEARYRKLM